MVGFASCKPAAALVFITSVIVLCAVLVVWMHNYKHVLCT